MQKLILRSHQSPGDILMATAAVRDLHRALPRQFQTDVRTAAPDLWENNPYLTPLVETDPEVKVIDLHYPLIHSSNQLPYHFIHGYRKYLEQQLDVPIPATEFRGDVHLTDTEKHAALPGSLDPSERFWIIIAGGKYDFTAKWWDPCSYQKVVDHFRGRIHFVQCGELGHWHPRLDGVTDLVGRTTIREFIRLMYHADGVICPVTFAMHLAAAVETPPGRPCNRAAVVISGGREPPQWEAYPHHQFISTNGALTCCSDGGCWKSRCQQVGDGNNKDLDLCEQPIEVRKGLMIPRCMQMITPQDVIRRVEMYHDGGALKYLDAALPARSDQSVQNRLPERKGNGMDQPHPQNGSQEALSVSFYHGLGDASYFAKMIPLYTSRGYSLSVECTPDKAFLFEAAGAKTLATGEGAASHAWAYPADHRPRAEQGSFWRGSKIGHNLSEAPMSDIGKKDVLWDEYVASEVDIAAFVSENARKTAQSWFDRLQKPIVLFHQKGNTAQARKSLPDTVTKEFYEAFIDHCDGTLVLMDWDQRVPRLTSHRVRHLSDLGTCTTELMFAMMLQADLFIGVDSGPLHAAHLANVPALGVWMPEHYPSTYTLPRKNQLNVVLSEPTREWNRFKRIPWRIVEHPGSQFTGNGLADFARAMLQPARYIPEDIAADVQMQQFVSEFCRCTGTSSLAHYWDRNRSFDVLLREMTSRFRQPNVLETGTIRAEEDWGGAGFFTYLMGAYLHHRGGHLDSVDITDTHCRFATEWTKVFGDTVSVHCDDSLSYLSTFDRRVDVLYVDSLDTTEPRHAEHALAELRAIEQRLSNDSLIVFDDSPWHAGATVGKGAKAVPWLLDRGWEVLYAGYQVIMTRTREG